MSAKWDFKGKVVAITGAASGMGLATATLLAASGAKVSMADIQTSLLEKEAAKLRSTTGAEVLAVTVDVSDGKQVDSWIEKTVEAFGMLDGAANFAGILSPGHQRDSLWEETDENWNLVVGINFTGMLNCNRAQIKHMKPEGGAIVNTSSVAGERGFLKRVSYNATKHGVNGITRSAALDAGEKNIRVNCIAPGPIDTPMGHKSAKATGQWFPLNGPIKRRGYPSEVANLAAFLLADTSSYITGAIHTIDGGWSI